VERHIPWWSYLGAICGAGIGFIIANIPGLMLGAVAGNRLGAIRDAKGKSVAAVFTQLSGNQKAEVSWQPLLCSFLISMMSVLDSSCIGFEGLGFGFVSRSNEPARGYVYLLFNW